MISLQADQAVFGATSAAVLDVVGTRTAAMRAAAAKRPLNFFMIPQSFGKCSYTPPPTYLLKIYCQPRTFIH